MKQSTVFVVCGGPGAGKSTYAQRLAEQRQAVLLDIDAVTDRLVRLALAESGHDEDDRDSDFFKKRFRGPIYDTLFDIARENLARLDVVIVAPFTSELRDSSWPARLRASLGTPVEVHYIDCQPEVRRERLAQRGAARDSAKLADWDSHMLSRVDGKPPEFSHIYVDTSDWKKE
jgi:predicted kinase